MVEYGHGGFNLGATVAKTQQTYRCFWGDWSDRAVQWQEAQRSSSLSKQTLPTTPKLSADTWPDIREEVLGAKPSSKPQAAPLAVRPLLLNFWPESTLRLLSGSGLQGASWQAEQGVKKIKIIKKNLEETLTLKFLDKQQMFGGEKKTALITFKWGNCQQNEFAKCTQVAFRTACPHLCWQKVSLSQRELLGATQGVFTVLWSTCCYNAKL